jgi:hypothetical protein
MIGQPGTGIGETGMKAKVFEAMNGSIMAQERPGASSQAVPLETALNQFLSSLDEVKKGQGVHFITQSECLMSQPRRHPIRHTTVTVLYE